MTADHDPEPNVDLAHEADFALGAMQVRPSASRVRVGDRDVRVEPRVMQVLVVLTRAGGATVTRDALIEACWGGRIVSDDAISRIIAKVRALARLSEPPAFVLETLPKVGFQLVADGGATAGAAQPSRPRRRRRAILLAAIGGFVLLAVAALAWRTFWPSMPAHQNGRVEVVAFEATQPDAEVSRRDTAAARSSAKLSSRPANLPASVENLV